MNIKKATLLGMLLAFGLSICSTFAVSVHDNQATFKGYEVIAVSFEWSGAYCITDKQPWGDSDHPNAVYINNTPIGTIIDIYCGRKESNPVADYFNSLSPTGSNTWGSSLSYMNFAIQGTLTINSDRYSVVLGQLPASVFNVWVIGGQNFRYGIFQIAGSSFRAVITPDSKYAICLAGNDSFTVFYTNNAQSKTSSK